MDKDITITVEISEIVSKLYEVEGKSSDDLTQNDKYKKAAVSKAFDMFLASVPPDKTYTRATKITRVREGKAKAFVIPVIPDRRIVMSILDRRAIDHEFNDSIEYLCEETAIDFEFIRFFSDDLHEEIEKQIEQWEDVNYKYRIYLEPEKCNWFLLRKLKFNAK